MSRLLFVDPATPRPYDPRTFFDRAHGAVETSVLRVAEGLAQRGHRVTVAQNGRLWPERSAGGVRYVALDGVERARRVPADAVVVVGPPEVLTRMRQAAPEARLLLWLHGPPDDCGLAQAVAASGASVLAASETHRAQIAAFIHGAADGGRRGPAWAPVVRLHGPIDDTLAPDGTAVQPDKLVVLAESPPAEALAAFEILRRHRPTARLHVLGPVSPTAAEGVVWHGALPHRAALRHVREAFAVLGPLATHAPTWTVPFVEANAVGTPVVGHAHAALAEALGETAADGRQLVDARDATGPARRLAAWWDGDRPLVTGPPPFRLAAVLDGWERLVGRGTRHARTTMRRLRAVAVA